MSQQLASLLVDLRVNSAELRSEIGKANAHLKSFGDAAKTAAGVAAAAFAAFGVAQWGKDAVHAFTTTQKHVTQLGATFKRLGYESKQLTAQFAEQASKMQSTLGVSDDMVLQMQTLLVAFGVAPKQIDSTVKALVDYATLTGEDAVGATQKLVEAINSGSMKALKSMGIMIKDTGDKSKNLALAVDELNKKFGGAAAANAGTLGGKMQILSAQWEDMQKAFGGFVATIESKLHVLEKLTLAFEGLTRVMSGEFMIDQFKVEQMGVVQNAQKRVLDAQRRVALYERKDSYGGALYGSADKANAAKELADAQAALQVAARAMRTSLGAGDSGSVTAGQSAAAKAAFGASTAKQKEIDELTAKTIKDYEKRVAHEAKQAAEERKRADKRFRDQERDAEAYARDLETAYRKAGEATAEGLEEWEKSLNDARQKVIDDEVAASRARLAASDSAFGALRDSILSAAMSIGMTVVGKLGRLGGVANAAVGGAMQGMQYGMAAGPGGALGGAMAGSYIAGMAELVGSSEAFQGTVAILDDVVSEVAEAYGEVAAVFKPLLNVVLEFTRDALRPFKTSIAFLGQVFERLAPALEPLVQVSAAFTDVLFRMVFTTEHLAAAMWGWETVGRGLFDATKFAGTTLLSVSAGIVKFWNDLIGQFADALRSVADMEVAGAKPFAFLDGVARAVGGLGLPTLAGTLEESASKLGATTFPTFTTAVEEATDATKEATRETQKFAASWFNVPDGYKINEARYDAMFAEGGSLGTASGTFAGGAPISVTIVSEDPRHIWTKLQPLIQRDKATRYFGLEEGD